MLELTFDVVDPRSDVALWALGEYFDELDRRFVGGFDPGDTLVVDAPSLRPPGGLFVIASTGGEPAACGGLVRVDDQTLEIKRMWVSPQHRGAGIARRLLAELERLAVAHGAMRVVLDTNAVLVEAISMYESSGYTATERYNDNPYAMRWFTKDVGGPVERSGSGKG